MKISASSAGLIVLGRVLLEIWNVIQEMIPMKCVHFESWKVRLTSEKAQIL